MRPDPRHTAWRTVRSTARNAAKRILDVVGATAGLVLFAPVVAAAALAVLVTMGRPVIYRHVRPGRDGVPFALCKLRTMRPPHEGEVWFRTDADRLTRLGRVLRKISVDELPGLWNVLKGEMSLVGPRPLLMEYLPHYTAEHFRRHAVKPGLTGWAQVHGRASIPLSRRFELDVWYVDNWTLALDLKIIAMTAWQALFGRGVLSGQDIDSIDDLGLARAADPAACRPPTFRPPTGAR